MSSQATGHLRSIVGANIAAGRKRRKLSQRQLGGLVNGVDAATVSRWERGVVMPSTANLVTLAEVFEVDPSWFHVDHDRKHRYTHEENPS